MSEERFDTRNFERYAMSVLMEFYCREWDCFRYGQGVESPDLQCEKLSIGIEVTRAIDRENGIPAEIIFEYFGNWNQTKQESGIASVYGRIRRFFPLAIVHMNL